MNARVLRGRRRAAVVEVAKTPQSAHFMDWQRWWIMRMLFTAEGGGDGHDFHGRAYERRRRGEPWCGCR